MTIGWDPIVDGHLAIVGGPRSGRTAAARTLLHAATDRWPSDRLHVYVLDGSGALGEIDGLAHCGAVVQREELSRTLRLVTWLGELISERQNSYGATGFVIGEPDPRILLVIDGWEVFQELSNEQTLGELEDIVGQLLRDGASVGVSVVATGGRALLSGRVSAQFTSTMALRMADPSDLLMAGLRSTQIPGDMPPGRALLLPGGEELQIAVHRRTTQEPGPRLATASRRGSPVRIDALATYVHISDLDVGQLGLVTVGRSVDGPAVLPLGERGDAGWLVCGPPRSGRSTTLAVLATILCSSRAVGWIGATTPPDSIPDVVAHLAYDDLSAVNAWCLEHPAGAVLVDDADQLIGMPAEPAVLEHLARSRSTGAVVCASGVAADLGNSYRGLAPELRRRRTGILLQPGRHDGDLFGIRIGPMDHPRPGRGLLVLRGSVSDVQVATP